MEPQQLKSAIESLLFVSSKPLGTKDFLKLLEVEAESLHTALTELVAERKNSGIVLLDNDGQYQLATNSDNTTIVKNFLNAELREKLTDATVEVLAIITYRQPISKAEIEAIRGVNSQYSLRHLLMRGIIDKVPNPSDARGFLYQTSTEFLQHLGIASIHDLPEFEKLVENIKLPITPSLPQEAAENEQPIPSEAPTDPTEQGSNLDTLIAIEKEEPEDKEDFAEEDDEDDDEE